MNSNTSGKAVRWIGVVNFHLSDVLDCLSKVVRGKRVIDEGIFQWQVLQFQIV